MLRFLLDKFKQAPGPLKEARLIAGDIAEEILDVAEYYLKRAKSGERDNSYCQSDSPTCANPPQERDLDRTSKQISEIPAPASPEVAGLKRSLEVDGRLAVALETGQNRKKQEFKILAILWDANQREMGKLTAKAVSEHGEKLGVSIRHENVRKVIRMRLDKHVEIHTEQVGNGSIYKYQLSPLGKDHFENRFLK